VVGEGQILAQVRSCSMHGNDESGSFGTILSRMFNSALKSGKRVRTETGISKGAVSISSAAVELAILRSEEKLGKPLKGSRACIVGAGTMSRLAITHLLSQDVTDIHIVNRGRERMEEMANGFPDAELNLYLLDELWDQMMQADLIITSTSSTGCIVTKDNLAANWKDRTNPLMLIDISVPRNVESETNDLDNVVAYNVDDLKQVMALNQAQREKEVIEARKIVEEEISSFWTWKESLRCIPAIRALRQRGTKIIEGEIANYDSKLSKLSSKERQMVERMLSSVVNKLMAGPLSELREGTTDVDIGTKLDLVKAMFKLDLDDE
jgi:glutamyl-tRNA reductase